MGFGRQGPLSPPALPLGATICQVDVAFGKFRYFNEQIRM
eukprot:SAG31_NODE_3691_length_3985_cov_3.675244_3_plen_40_part_00